MPQLAEHGPYELVYQPYGCAMFTTAVVADSDSAAGTVPAGYVSVLDNTIDTAPAGMLHGTAHAYDVDADADSSCVADAPFTDVSEYAELAGTPAGCQPITHVRPQ